MAATYHHARRLYIGTTAERAAVVLDVDGIGTDYWDTDVGVLYIWDGTAWVAGFAALPHSILSATHDDTTPAVVVRGDLMTGQGVAPLWQRLAHPGAANRVLQSTALEVGWSAGSLVLGGFTLTVPATGTAVIGGGAGAANRVAYWTDANTLASDAGLFVDAANDLYLVADGGGIGNSNTTARLVFDSSGATDYAYFVGCNVAIGTTSTVANQELHATAGNNATFWLTDADVNHPFTAPGFVPEIEADVLGVLTNWSGLAGGVQLAGFSDADSPAAAIIGHIGNATPTNPAVIIGGWKTDGATGRAVLAATEKVLQIRNGAGVLATVLGSGDVGLLTITPNTPLGQAGWVNSGLCIGSGSASAGLVLFSAAASTTSALRFGDGAAGAYDQGFVKYNHSADAMTLGTARGTRITIDNAGNIGIMKVPAVTLDVAGSVRIDGDEGGLANTVTLTDATNAGSSSLVGFWKIYIGATEYSIPYYTNTP